MTNEEILKANNYKQWETGGGCTAWGKDFDNGKSVLIGRDGSDNVDENDSEYKKLDIYDVEHCILSGKIRRNWPKSQKCEIVGNSLDERTIGGVCRITANSKVCVITTYEDKS